MAKKRDRKPREPIPEETLEVLEEILVPEPQEDLEEQDVRDIIDNMFGPSPKKAITPVIQSPTQSPTYSPPSSVDEYIRSQVLKEMYGTETPSEYDKIQLALKRLL